MLKIRRSRDRLILNLGIDAYTGKTASLCWDDPEIKWTNLNPSMNTQVITHPCCIDFSIGGANLFLTICCPPPLTQHKISNCIGCNLCKLCNNHAMCQRHFAFFSIPCARITAWPAWNNKNRLTPPNFHWTLSFVVCFNNLFIPLIYQYMMTSRPGNAFYITGLLCGKSSVTGGFPIQIQSTVEFLCFLIVNLASFGTNTRVAGNVRRLKISIAHVMSP